MKKLQIPVALVIAALGSVFLFAEKKEFWATKPYTEWTQKDVDKMLKDSPWAKTIPLSEAPQLAPRSGGRGGQVGEVESGGIGAGSEGYRAQPRLVITWYSRPVREAVARRIQLNNPSAPKEQIDKLLNRPESSFYELLIVGWSPGRSPNAVEALREGTYLQKKNKEKLPLKDALMPQKRGDPLVIRFVREADGKPILTLDDREVHLVLKLGDNTVRTTFRLSDMVVNGRLEL